MDLRTELLEWLAALPAMETPEDRKALLALTGPASASLYLDWEGSSRAFVDQLLGTLSWDGKATLVAFLAALQNQSWLQAAAERAEELAALRSQVEALDDAEFEATFLVPGPGEILETSAEPPDESLSWELPAAPAPEPPAEGFPEPEPELELEDTPKGAPSKPASRPRRPFESMEDLEPGGLDIDQDVETVGPGATVTGAVIGGSGSVTVGGEHHHGNEIDTGGGTYVGGSADVGGDLIGRDQVVHGDQVTGPKYEAGTINIYHGTPDAGLLARPSAPTSPLIEEAIRLDVAAPPAATLELPFDLAVAVRQPDAPTLSIEDLTQVKSQDGTIFRREEEEIVFYRVAVTAAGCDVQPPHYILKLRPRGNSAPCWFQITPHRPGKQSIVVTAYQQDDALAAQTRLSIEVQVPVSPTP